MATTWFTRFARFVSRFAGHPATFVAGVAVVLVWALLGPVFDYSDTWQLVINTGTTVVTFLMVFLIQNTQTRDTMAIQAKLDELIRSEEGAHNRLLDLEDMEDRQLEAILLQYRRLARAAQAELQAGHPDMGTPSFDVKQALEDSERRHARESRRRRSAPSEST